MIPMMDEAAKEVSYVSIKIIKISRRRPCIKCCSAGVYKHTHRTVLPFGGILLVGRSEQPASRKGRISIQHDLIEHSIIKLSSP